jgi:hypothetical protein
MNRAIRLCRIGKKANIYTTFNEINNIVIRTKPIKRNRDNQSISENNDNAENIVMENTENIVIENTDLMENEESIKKRLRPQNLDTINYNDDYREVDEKWKLFNYPMPEDALWVSPSNLSYLLLDDPFCTWMKLHRSNFRKQMLYKCSEYQMPSELDNFMEKTIKNEQSALNIIFEKGNKFENEICGMIDEKFKGETVRIASSYMYRANIDEWKNKFNETVEHIKKGTPIIFQGVLMNEKIRTRGIADIIIRVDYLDKMFEGDYITDDELNYKVIGCEHPHYVVIDIKWSILELCVNDNTVRNCNRFPSNKGQLTLYNSCLGEIQGYIPEKAYFLGKGWTRKTSTFETTKYFPFDCLGVVDFVGFDFKYIEITRVALENYYIIYKNGDKWILFDENLKPSHEFLSPNMNNKYDTPFHEIKHLVAKVHRNLTLIPYLGAKHQKIGFSNNVKSYDDMKASASMFGIKNNTFTQKIVDQNIKVNREKIELLPKIITNNYLNWQHYSPFDFYVDFEMINSTHDKYASVNIKDTHEKTYTYLIGIGYYDKHNNVFKYKYVMLKQRTADDEISLYIEFMNILKNETKKIADSLELTTIPKPTIYHWGHAEVSELKRVMNKYNLHDMKKHFLESYNWLDFTKVLKDGEEPVAVRGAFGYGLKQLSQALHKMNKINAPWTKSNVMSGYDALTVGNEIYHWIEMDDEIEKNKYFIQMKELIDNTIAYNMADCMAVYNIVDYLRENHINKN